VTPANTVRLLTELSRFRALTEQESAWLESAIFRERYHELRRSRERRVA